MGVMVAVVVVIVVVAEEGMTDWRLILIRSVGFATTAPKAPDSSAETNLREGGIVWSAVLPEEGCVEECSRCRMGS